MIVRNDKEGPRIFEEGLQKNIFCIIVCLFVCLFAEKTPMSSFTSVKWDLGSGSIETAKANEEDDDDGGEDDEDEDEDGDPGLVPLPPGLVRLLQALPAHQTHTCLKLIL